MHWHLGWELLPWSWSQVSPTLLYPRSRIIKIQEASSKIRVYRTFQSSAIHPRIGIGLYVLWSLKRNKYFLERATQITSPSNYQNRACWCRTLTENIFPGDQSKITREHRRKRNRIKVHHFCLDRTAKKTSPYDSHLNKLRFFLVVGDCFAGCAARMWTTRNDGSKGGYKFILEFPEDQTFVLPRLFVSLQWVVVRPLAIARSHGEVSFLSSSVAHIRAVQERISSSMKVIYENIPLNFMNMMFKGLVCINWNRQIFVCNKLYYSLFTLI